MRDLDRRLRKIERQKPSTVGGTAVLTPEEFRQMQAHPGRGDEIALAGVARSGRIGRVFVMPPPVPYDEGEAFPQAAMQRLSMPVTETELLALPGTDSR